MLKPIRVFAGGVGVVFFILALVTLGSQFVNTDLFTEIVFKAIIAGCFLAVGTYLLSFRTQLRIRWAAVWLIGWVLALGAVCQLPYSILGICNATDLSGKLGSLFWIFMIPLQLAMGVKAIGVARRGSAVDANDLLAKDPRQPILYLRPFALDARTAKVQTRKSLTSFAFNTRTEEELVAQVMNDIGPCVAIGRPGERLPRLGFHRIYVTDDQWRDKVLEFMSKARLVVFMGGPSENFSWEIRKAVDMLKPEQLLFFVPNDASQGAGFMWMLRSILPHPLPEVPSQAVFRNQSFRAVSYFGPDWTPHWAVPGTPGHLRQALTQKLTPALKMALQPVFEQIGGTWKRPPIVYSRILFEAAALMFVIFALVIVISSH